MKPSPLRRPLQVATFFRKEAVDVLHQPRLLLTLVVGPFLVMALFGLGYRDSPARLRTEFVAPAGSPFLDQVQNYAGQIGNYVKYEGVTTDPAAARRKLLDGQIDLIVSFPDKPLDTVLSGNQATITLVHTRLDPIEQTAISFASQISVDQINGQILAGIVSGGQALAGPATDVIQRADQAAAAVNSGVTAGDPAATQAAIDELDTATAQVAIAIRASAALASEVGAADGSAASGGSATAAGIGQDAVAAVDELQRLVGGLSTATPESIDATTGRIQQILADVGANYTEFTTADPAVLVRPFKTAVDLAVPDVNQVSDWYAPAAVVLMLQQFGVAFGALSFVRERQLGIVDVFRVAPVNATEMLLGKYLSYTIIGGGIGALLTALVVKVLDVPIQTSIGQVAIVMGLSLFASIGLGFVISLASGSDAQAVQYTMILLLASLFFSGFFLSSGQLKAPATVVGWLLPVTYGMRMLRDVMLRGAPLDPDLVLALVGYGVVTFGLALLGARRRMRIAR